MEDDRAQLNFQRRGSVRFSAYVLHMYTTRPIPVFIFLRCWFCFLFNLNTLLIRRLHARKWENYRKKKRKMLYVYRLSHIGCIGWNSNLIHSPYTKEKCFARQGTWGEQKEREKILKTEVNTSIILHVYIWRVYSSIRLYTTQYDSIYTRTYAREWNQLLLFEIARQMIFSLFIKS